jgi:hypothetical protein
MAERDQHFRDAGDHVTSLPKAEQDLNVADVDGEPDGRCRRPGLRDAFTHRGAACFEPKR